jgi:hypothetical protein
VKELLNKFRIAVTGRWAVSFPTSVLTIAVGVVFAIERESLLVPDQLNSRLLIIACGELIAALYLFTVQSLLLGSRKTKQQKIAVCVFVWFSTGVIRGTSAAFYAHFALKLDFEFLTRISYATLFSGFTLAALAFYAGSVEKNQIENKALRSLTDFLEHDEAELTENEINERTEALEEIKRSILPKAQQVQELAKGLENEDLIASKETLQILRRQSEQLALSIENERKSLIRHQLERDEAHEYAGIRVTFFTGLFPKTISVRITMLVFVFGALAAQLPRNGLAGGKFAVIDGIVIMIMLFIFSRISRRLNGTPLILIYPIAYGAVFTWQFLLLKYQKEIGFDLMNPNQPIAGALKTLVNVYVPSVIASLITDSSRENEALTSESKNIRARVKSLSKTTEQLKNKVVAARFGAIQGKISGVIMALQIMQDTEEPRSEITGSNKFLLQTIKLLDEAIVEIGNLGRQFDEA